MPYAVNANNKSQRKRKIDERKEEEPFGSMAKTRLKKKYHSTFFVPSCERSKQLWASVSGWVCVRALSRSFPLSRSRIVKKCLFMFFMFAFFASTVLLSLTRSLIVLSLWVSPLFFFRFSSDWLMFLAVLYTLPFLSKKLDNVLFYKKNKIQNKYNL